MKDKIKNYCETCKVRLNKRNFKKHFDLNHTIHTSGIFVIPIKDTPRRGCIKGIALNNAEAGEEVIIAL